MDAASLNSSQKLPKKLVKFIKSLRTKKSRLREKAFVVEGAKSVKELLLSDYNVTIVIGTPQFMDTHTWLLAKESLLTFQVAPAFLASLGTFQSNNAALAVVNMPVNKPLTLANNVCGLVLDDIRDPGNLGAILRIAHWYGIDKVICSETTVDLYNPKVLHASMGAFTQVHVYYTDLVSYLSKTTLPVLGAFVQGENVHTISFPPAGWLVIGNESRGISHKLMPYINQKIGIPQYRQVESLNAAIATAVICDNWRRWEEGVEA